MIEEANNLIEPSGSKSLAADGSATPWICTPLDRRGNPLGLKGKPANEFTPVHVRASSKDGAEKIARYWLGVFGYRGKFRISITPRTPRSDGMYVVRKSLNS